MTSRLILCVLFILSSYCIYSQDIIQSFRLANAFKKDTIEKNFFLEVVISVQPDVYRGGRFVESIQCTPNYNNGYFVIPCRSVYYSILKEKKYLAENINFTKLDSLCLIKELYLKDDYLRNDSILFNHFYYRICRALYAKCYMQIECIYLGEEEIEIPIQENLKKCNNVPYSTLFTRKKIPVYLITNILGFKSGFVNDTLQSSTLERNKRFGNPNK